MTVSKFLIFKLHESRRKPLLISLFTTRRSTLMPFTRWSATCRGFLSGRSPPLFIISWTDSPATAVPFDITRRTLIASSVVFTTSKTVQLHSRIDEAMCQYCGWNGPLVSDRFCGSDLTDSVPRDCAEARKDGKTTMWHWPSPSERRSIRRRKPQERYDWRTDGARSGDGSRSRLRGGNSSKSAWSEEVSDGALSRREGSGLIHRLDQ